VAAAVEEVAASGARDIAAPAAAAVEEAVAAGAQEEEAPAEDGLVDIASILGAPAVTIVRSNL
jgi:predicted secreted protein